MIKNLTKAALLVACLMLVVSTVSAGGKELPKAGEYVINSQPQFRVTVGDSEELVKCEAVLVLKTTDPYVTDQNTRRVDVQVVDWKATGTSELLGGQLQFRMIPGSVDEESYIEAKSAESFPAHAQFAIKYEMETPFGVMTNLVGVTWGQINAFPPAPGDTMQLRKGAGGLVAQLMPVPLSAMSAAGAVQAQSAAVEAVSCFHVLN